MTRGSTEGRSGAPLRVRAATLLVLAIYAATGFGTNPAVLAAASPTPAAGFGESGISVEPAHGLLPVPWLVYEIDPGAGVSDAVLVRNDSDTGRSLDLYPADAQLQPSGAFTADLQGVRPKAVGAWTSLDTSHFDLAPHTSRRVALTLTVPAGTDPGEYYGSVLAQFQDTSRQQLRVVHRIGLRIYLTVKGAVVEAGTVTAFTSGHWWQRGWPTDPVEFETTFKNTGTVHLRLTGTVGAAGDKLVLGQAGGFEVAPPRLSVSVLTPWGSHPFIGPYRAQVEVTYANHKTGRALATTEVWIIPWKLLLLILAIAVLLGYAAWHLARWVRRRLGFAVSLDGVTMRMTLVHPEEHPPSVPPAPDGQQAVVAAVQVSNRGRRPFRFDPGHFELLDQLNHAFAARLLADEPSPDVAAGAVPPEGREVFVLLFTLPAGARPRVGVYRSRAGSLLVEAVPWR